MALSVSLVLLVGLTLLRARRDFTESSLEFGGFTMGTTYTVKIDASVSADESRRVRTLVQARLDEVNRLMSTFDSTSTLSRFNRYRLTGPYPVGDELVEVLAMAQEVSERSEGAFDVTVAPLVNAWGFGPGGRGPTQPGEAELAALRESVGYQRIRVDRAAGSVSKTNPAAVVDLSAIAKGYGVERLASALVELGFTRFLVEVGGELKATGRKRDGSAWRVGIENPHEGATGVFGTVELSDDALATSGDYRNFYESEGVRFAHIIDPRTGLPIRSRGLSVSVAHDNAAMADAWATALMVLGPDEGYDLAEREGIAAFFVMQSNGVSRPRTTASFTRRLGHIREVGGR